jgi:hypothetical protein
LARFNSVNGSRASPNQFRLNLYNLLYPVDSKGGPATPSNYFVNDTARCNSYNDIINVQVAFKLSF